MSIHKECQVIMLETKKSKLHLCNKLLISSVVATEESALYDNIPQHLYILSDEKIEKDDWKYCSNTNQILQARKLDKNNICKDCKKIIATTNSDLNYTHCQSEEESNNRCKERCEHCIEYYKPVDIIYPQIPNSFIEQYIKSFNEGKAIDKVLVEYGEHIFSHPDKNIKKGDFGLFVQNNEIIIKPIKDSWNRKEIEKIANLAYWTGSNDTKNNKFFGDTSFDSWIIKILK